MSLDDSHNDRDALARLDVRNDVRRGSAEASKESKRQIQGSKDYMFVVMVFLQRFQSVVYALNPVEVFGILAVHGEAVPGDRRSLPMLEAL